MLRMTEQEYRILLKADMRGGSVIDNPKPSKYGNVKTEVDGIEFDSKREAQRYTILKLRMAAGEIRGLALQERYPLEVNGQLVCTYVGDFSYWEGDKKVTEDAKGHRTKDYIIKKKLMKAVYGIEVREI